MSGHLTAQELLAGGGGLCALVWVWRAVGRRARAAADAARSGVRLVSLAGRVLLTASLLVGVQWGVITHPGNPWVTLAVLALPDLLAGYVLTRALTVTTVDLRGVGGRAGRGRRDRWGGGR
jgi:hypothetical protein